AGAEAAAPDPPGRRRARRLRLAGRTARVRGGGLACAPAPPRLRPRHPCRPGGPGRLRLLPRQPAQHLHRPAHPRHAARGAAHGGRRGRTALAAVPRDVGDPWPSLVPHVRLPLLVGAAVRVLDGDEPVPLVEAMRGADASTTFRTADSTGGPPLTTYTSA